ncbi:mannonate dehydratase [Fulvivirgaceae bacterium BMA10]|uniref:Mannonate dehydratase n=1 Tax=Splendidivirga corallicola TaxID=3051826 RepID=A0ABT8KWA8_9BACT|nr:mannonate dehydratase [Fulvivirgaceae bacterium BMA10]
MVFEQTWRWFGPDDPVSLSDARQAGATGIVTALHHVPNGQLWHVEEIQDRKTLIENAGMQWSVVESLPVHEEIKTRTGQFRSYIENYKQSIVNLGKCGVKVVCYNFMPVLDWTRTDLRAKQPSGAKAARFDFTVLAAFDLYILEREGAESDYSDVQINAAHNLFKEMSPEETDSLLTNILAGLPGSEERYTLSEFKAHLNIYKNIGATELRGNLKGFLQEVVPVAEDCGVKLVIHPDDPPISILGLPRIVGNADDLRFILNAVESPSNGLTFCTGSLGVNSKNDLPGMIKEFGHRINFYHLRNVKRDAAGNFYETNHLEGDIDMYAVIQAVFQVNRNSPDIQSKPKPMRPDHGLQMLDDLSKEIYPGYSGIGRLKGLAELRGLELAIKRSLEDYQ